MDGNPRKFHCPTSLDGTRGEISLLTERILYLSKSERSTSVSSNEADRQT